MRRRPHCFALAPWIVAIIYLLAGIPAELEVKRAIMAIQSHSGEGVASALSWANILERAQATVAMAMELFALGVLIDIADRIRRSLAGRRD